MAKKAGPPTKSDILNQIAKDTELSANALKVKKAIAKAGDQADALS